MRENRTFGERTRISDSDRTLKKYYLVCEGTDTEGIYFKAVESLRNKSRINPLIELISIDRSYNEKNWSNPKKILDQLISDIEEINTGFFSYNTLLNKIMGYFEDNNSSSEKIWNLLLDICKNKMEKLLEEDVEDIEKDCSTIIEYLKEELKMEDIIPKVSQIIENGELTYKEGFDKICIIVDRDKKSFVSDQYDYVISKCKEKGFGFYITNPCFEFWLLLHFDEVFSLDQNKLLENPKVKTKRRYTEDELRKNSPNYDKAKYDAKSFVNNIDKAIENEKKFCEDIKKLENMVGSNIGTLIQEMRN